MTRVAGILLAAGEGSRLGQPKALVELGGQTLAERGVAMLYDGGAAPVIVVAGPVRVSVPTAWTVRNLDWRTGMGSSVRTGLQSLDLDGGPGDAPIGPRPQAGELAGIGAAIIALADQPLVGAEAVQRLIAAYAGGAQVAVAAYDGQPRNPVLIAREHWPAVIELATGDAGARPFLRARPELVTLVECGDTGSPFDIDTQADLDRVSSMFT
ncbi:MAG TPA: nucleotidyltransferase family protein [Trebonia sp.]|nr:nucleotidyltransferase family protein [Trebonia sp.]